MFFDRFFSKTIILLGSLHLVGMTDAVGQSLCSLVTSEEKAGLYMLGRCDGKKCLVPVAKSGVNLNGNILNTAYISGKAQNRNSLVVFQLKHMGVRVDEENLKSGKKVNLFRDKVDFLCNGEKDEISSTFVEKPLVVEEVEYDRYHRFFYVRKRNVGEQLYQLFHVNYFRGGKKGCVRTDDVSRRYLFLLQQRLLNYGRVAGFVDRLPFRTSRAQAQTKETELNEVVMKNYSVGASGIGCAELSSSFKGEAVKVSVTDVEDSVLKVLTNPAGVFSSRVFKKSR